MVNAKALSLKMRPEVWSETEAMVQKLHLKRNDYINKALDYYNAVNKRELLRKKLTKESKLVSVESLAILSDLEKLK